MSPYDRAPAGIRVDAARVNGTVMRDVASGYRPKIKASAIAASAAAASQSGITAR
jgi:hypothetical protein